MRNFSERDGLTSKGITAIYRDKRGDLWIGGEGVYKFNGKSFDRGSLRPVDSSRSRIGRAGCAVAVFGTGFT